MPAVLILTAITFAVLGWATTLMDGEALSSSEMTAAATLLDRHRDAVSAVVLDPSLSGEVAPTPRWWAGAGAFRSCADGVGGVATFSTETVDPKPDRVGRELEALQWGAAGAGLASGGVVVNARGTAIPLPCAVPDGAPAVVTRTR